MTTHPTVTAAGRRLLGDLVAAADDGRAVYVLRDPGAWGAGIHRGTWERLRTAGLVELGTYVPMKGRPLLVTNAGRELLAGESTTNTSTEEPPA